ncbi:MAG TPA: c-type cytochrome [Aromatoleum sp.]|uniref:c-type cytochrome n=1 Tax=Aromatoleum sp. TaxID=2307007 RepID=UPI002B4A265A|nr:c-type cytochrome [Aromatoleum sp.]HJV28571.1 c-type cytochrome [Aromatoleum sp.]
MLQSGRRSSCHRLVTALAGAALLSLAASASAELSDDAAKKLLKSNDCFKCHALDKTKKGPSYDKIAAKYKGKPDAVEKLNHNLTDAPKVKLEDGTEEEHKVLKTDTPQEKSDLIKWILAR